jgi:hypothetical protein
MAGPEHLNSQQFFHITDNPKFALDPTHRPENNTTVGGHLDPGIFLTKSPESWVNGHGYVRPYVAEIHAHPDIDQAEGVHGGYQGEKYVPAAHFDKLQVKRVIPLDAHAREAYGAPGWVEGHLGTTFDTGEKIKEPGWGAPVSAHYPYQGYTYPGPDVRDLPKKETNRQAARVRKYHKTRDTD